MAARESQWLMDLSPAEIGELEAAAEPLVAAESNIGAMKQSDFSLPAEGNGCEEDCGAHRRQSRPAGRRSAGGLPQQRRDRH
jgi:hypothetical protein